MTLAQPDFRTPVSDGLRGPSYIIWLSAGAVTVFLIWAAFAQLDQIVRAPGAMISASRPQIIQNLEGGILAELSVREGQVVEEGQVLARLHATQYQSTVDDLDAQIATLSVRKLRLEAEAAGQFDFAVPENVAAHVPDIVRSERTLLEARQADFVSRRDSANAVLAQATEERDVLEDLLAQEIVALIEVTRARKAFADAQAKRNEIETQAELERAQAYSDVLKELATLQQMLTAAKDQLRRATLVAPMRGIVQGLAVTTIGGVVRPGEEIAQIIPLNEALFVEARVAPKDIAGVRPGQAATVKLSAYDYTIYGALKGEVTLVSADTFKDERQPDGDPHYRVTVAVDPVAMTARQSGMGVRPGMLAEVELHTGQRALLHYLTKPLLKSREALREP